MSCFKFFKQIYINILKVMPTKMALYLIYFRGYHKKLNLKNPQYWGEKIQWLKLHGNLIELSEYVDKYAVRDYVKSKIGEEHLNDIYGVYINADDIDFSIFPDKFVIKSNNGSGNNIIVRNKNDINEKKIKKTLKKWLKEKYYKEKKEFQYKNVKNKIIVEKYLEDEGNGLIDYKFFCSNGEVRYYGIFYDRFTNKTIDYYDSNDNKMLVSSTTIKNSDHIENDKEKISKMKELAEILSEDFTFVRVDFYYVEGKIIFGELTFTDGAGSEPWKPLSFDKKVAEIIELKPVLKKKN